MLVSALPFDVRTNDVAHNLDVVERALRAARDLGIELVVLPEMWPTSFPAAGEIAEDLLLASDRALERVRVQSGELGLTICGSAYGRGGGRPTNRLHVFDHGRVLASYEKVHLFSPTAEDESFRAGDTPPATVDARAGRIAGVICYDLRFPELVRVPFRDGAALLAVVAQWPVERASQWEALVIGRAVENQCFVVACNRSGRASIGRRQRELVFPGNSLIVDPDGRVLARGSGSDELVRAELDLELARRMRVHVPVVKDQRPQVYARWTLPPGL